MPVKKKESKVSKVKKVTKASVKSTTTKTLTKVATKSTSIKKSPAISKSTPAKSSPKAVGQKVTGLSIQVYDTTGKVTGSVKLPEKVFGAKINKALLSQALHIYLTNASVHAGHTKTRGEVRGGGRKPWKQKGTGNARAGSKRSPLWVGGGIVFGPRKRDKKLDLPKKMKKAALISALSTKANDGSIKVISNLEKIQPKTKVMSNLLLKIEAQNPVLLVTGAKSKNLNLASRNIPNTSVETSTNLNAFIVWQNKNILISAEALEKFV